MASKRLIALFSELARLDGLPGKEAAVANYVLSFLKNLGLPVKVDGTAAAALSNTGNVICEVGGGGDFTLAAHMDTLYHTSATEAVVTADRITSGGKGPLGVHGRAGMAAVLYSLERAVHSGLSLKPFTAVFTTRAKGNMAGARHLSLPPRVRCAFVFGSELDPGTYTASSPGIALFSADVLGRSADAAAPETGISAITIAAKAIASLSLGRHDAETTSNIGTIAGGVNTGLVPLAALVRGQVRVADADKAPPVLDGIKAGFEKSAADAGGAVAFKWTWDYKPYQHAPGSEVLRLAEWAIRDAGLTPVPVASAGGNEANAFNGNGLAAVSFGIGARSLKQHDEYILLAHLAKASEIVSNLIKK